MAPTCPSKDIVPVPAMGVPPVMSPGVRRSMMPRENIMPALGPPTSFRLTVIVTGIEGSTVR